MMLPQSFENEVDLWIPSFDELTKQHRKLAEENPADVELVRQRDNQLQQLRERWDELVRKMEQKSSEVHIPAFSIYVITIGQCCGGNVW